MDRHARTPDPLVGTGNMAENWRNWREDFFIFMTVTEYNKKSNEMKANLLKNLIGKVGLAVINSFTYDEPTDKDDLGVLMSKLDRHFDPPKTETELRYKFFTKTRQNKETIEEFIADLREKAKVCDFGRIADSLVRDKVVLETKDKTLRKKYLAAENLTVEKMILMWHEHETLVEKMKQISMETTDRKAGTKPSTSGGKSNPVPDEKKKDGCWRCGRRHPPNNCPAIGVKCEKCGDKNHFSQCCPKKKDPEKPKGLDKNLLEAFYQNNVSGK